MLSLISFRPARRIVFTATALCLAVCWSPARADAPDNSAEIVVQALLLLGVPYRWGGNDPARGLDCSGFVRHVFKSVTALDLPRRSEQIGRLGQRVARADLRAGDLLFFNTLGRPNSHVAVYVGDGRFVHAPSRKGQVRVDGLEDRYWRVRFNGARRIELAGPEVPPVAALEAKSSPQFGWRSDDYPNGP